MVSGWNIKQVVKKKSYVSEKDKKDWNAFIKQTENFYDKDSRDLEFSPPKNKIKKLDLHGYSLNKANKVVKKFIMESCNEGYKKLLVVTGKGLRSQVYNDPYRSEKMSTLKHSVPEYIKNDDDLLPKVKKITSADSNHGGDGAIYIFLK